jgi:hypothetical protein
MTRGAPLSTQLWLLPPAETPAVEARLYSDVLKGRQRDHARRRELMLGALAEWRRQGRGTTKAFLAEWAAAHPGEHVPSVATLCNWNARVREEGPEGLVPHYHHAGGVVDAALAAYFTELVMQGRSVKAAWRATAARAVEVGLRAPCYHTWRRYAERVGLGQRRDQAASLRSLERTAQRLEREIAERQERLAAVRALVHQQLALVG